MKRIFITIIIILAIAVVSGIGLISFIDNPSYAVNSFEECVNAGYPVAESFPEQCRTPDGRTFTRSQNEPSESSIEVIAENLDIPWEVVFLKNNITLVTERPGNLVVIKNEEVKKIPVEGVYHLGEGGLLGMAMHPDFQENNFLYFYLTYEDSNSTKNKVERYKFENDSLSNKKTIISNIPGSSNHNGGRIAFGPDGNLYITTGDAGDESNAQDKNSLAGKILRVTDEGKIPADNPFKNAVYSYGHRNAQGLAWDDKGRLWASEHGRSGILSGYDELNLIEKGANYGWPDMQGDEEKEGMKRPVLHSGASKTWAPAGMAFLSGKLFFGGLRGEALYKVTLGEQISFEESFLKRFGRIRAVASDSEGNIYITTSNTDGRGKIKENDDKLIKIKMSL